MILKPNEYGGGLFVLSFYLIPNLCLKIEDRLGSMRSLILHIIHLETSSNVLNLIFDKWDNIEFLIKISSKNSIKLASDAANVHSI